MLSRFLTDDGHEHINHRRNPYLSLHRVLRDGAKAVDCPEPEFEADSFVTVMFRPNPEVRQGAGSGAGQVTGQVRLLRALSGEMTRHSLQEALGLRHRDYFNEIYLTPALEAGLIEMTIPDKPRSSKQRYRLTLAGSEFLKRIEEGQ